jgi:hypothetical protein
MSTTSRDVFINCPFDADYQKFFWTIVFVVIRSGFRPRCALEADDSSENRFDKICNIVCNIVKECRYGIHDISRTELDQKSKLPRFNMPLELGLFIAAKRFGTGRQKSKRCVILDKKRYRYQKYISDISGQDIRSHQGKIKVLVIELATWLRIQSRERSVPGGQKMAAEFDSFRRKVPKICANRNLQPKELTFGDYAAMVEEYLAVAKP